LVPFKKVVGTVMANNPTPNPIENFIPIEGIIEAPVIFFEVCPTLGNNNGLINIMLATGLIEPTPGGLVKTRAKAVAHLRMTTVGAIELRDTINKTLLIGAPVQNPEGKAN
jgi:hypothetical protein